MNRTGLSAAAALLIGLSLMFSDVAPAEAHTCSSLCNQVRRACLTGAKAVRQVARAVCDETRDGCRTDCAVNEATCPDDCVTECGTDQPCLDDCPDDCANCIPNCNADREGCLELAEQQRAAARVGCDGTRGGCQDTCVDPIDGDCVRDCGSDQRDCRADKKKIERQCKRDCATANGTGRRVCMRTCRKQYNGNLQACTATESSCLLTECIGSAPTE
jgi:hypothetical protein